MQDERHFQAHTHPQQVRTPTKPHPHHLQHQQQQQQQQHSLKSDLRLLEESSLHSPAPGSMAAVALMPPATFSDSPPPESVASSSSGESLECNEVICFSHTFIVLSRRSNRGEQQWRQQRFGRWSPQTGSSGWGKPPLAVRLIRGLVRSLRGRTATATTAAAATDKPATATTEGAGGAAEARRTRELGMCFPNKMNHFLVSYGIAKQITLVSMFKSCCAQLGFFQQFNFYLSRSSL